MELEDMFGAIGLSSAEERVYRALLLWPSPSVAELAREAEMDARDVRASIKSLEEKGLASRAAARGRFIAAPPDVGLQLLILRRQEELERARLAAQTLLKDFRRTLRRRSSTELVEVIVGREAIAQRVEQVQRAAEHEVLALVKPPFVVTGMVHSDLQSERLSRGIGFRVIYDRETLHLKGALDLIREDLAAGEQSRVLGDLPMRVLIADKTLGLIPLSLDESRGEEGDILIHASPLLDALVALFERLWVDSIPLRLLDRSVIEESEAGEVSRQDGEILALVAADLTDEAIARSLKIARRTAQRRIRTLMDRLGASSRVQLILQASRRGWI